MATITKIAGSTLSLSIDTTELGALDSIIFEVYKAQGRKTKLIYKYPLTTGYSSVTKVGSTYSFIITGDQSLPFSGSYGIEMTWDAGGVVSKAQTLGLTYVKQAV